MVECRYCHGTGDWRGKYAIGKPDCATKENICYHCQGTGIEFIKKTNICKYCGEPTDGYCCKECYNVFEEEVVYG